MIKVFLLSLLVSFGFTASAYTVDWKKVCSNPNLNALAKTYLRNICLQKAGVDIGKGTAVQQKTNQIAANLKARQAAARKAVLDRQAAARKAALARQAAARKAALARQEAAKKRQAAQKKSSSSNKKAAKKAAESERIAKRNKLRSQINDLKSKIRDERSKISRAETDVRSNQSRLRSDSSSVSRYTYESNIRYAQRAISDAKSKIRNYENQIKWLEHQYALA